MSLHKKKLLIISYWFEPQNNAAIERIGSWLKHLPSEELAVSCLTYDWGQDAINKQEFFRKPRLNYKEEKISSARVFKVRRYLNLRDYLAETKKWAVVRKVLSFLMIYLEHLSCYLADLKMMRLFLRHHLVNEKYDYVLVSGGPFTLFRLGAWINRRYDIRWIADYRDGWSEGFRFKLSPDWLMQLEQRVYKQIERKRLQTAHKVLTVSKGLAEDISVFLKRDVDVIYNGYDTYNPEAQNKRINEIVITFIGWLYGEHPEHDLKIVTQGIQKYTDVHSSDQNMKTICVQLVGNATSRQINTIEERLPKPHYLKYRCWVNKKEVEGIIKSSHFCLLPGFPGVKGILSTKLYSYFAYGVPFLLIPSDKGELEEMVKESRAGIVINNYEQLAGLLYEWGKDYDAVFATYRRNRNERFIMQFSRQKQAEKLASLFMS